VRATAERRERLVFASTCMTTHADPLTPKGRFRLVAQAALFGQAPTLHTTRATTARFPNDACDVRKGRLRQQNGADPHFAKRRSDGRSAVGESKHGGMDPDAASIAAVIARYPGELSGFDGKTYRDGYYGRLGAVPGSRIDDREAVALAGPRRARPSSRVLRSPGRANLIPSPGV
jgi:hypothetical protein